MGNQHNRTGKRRGLEFDFRASFIATQSLSVQTRLVHATCCIFSERVVSMAQASEAAIASIPCDKEYLVHEQSHA